MTPASPTFPAGADAERLCDLLLEAVGRSSVRMATARRHVEIMEAAIPYMTLTQRHEARQRIDRLETKWGCLLPGTADEPETSAISPETRVARWLSTRTVPERHLRVLSRAALRINEGETSLSVVMDYAFARETDHLLIPVGFDSFKEWLVELRIARREGRGIYAPGSLCCWWLSEMIPSKAKSSTYRACMERAWEMRHGHRAGA